MTEPCLPSDRSTPCPPLPDMRPGLRPPQFSLSTLLWAVTALGMLFAALAAVQPTIAFALVLAVLVIFAHVAGNALGTQLRNNGSVPSIHAQHMPPTPGVVHTQVTERHFAPATRLSRQEDLGRPLFWCVVGGAVMGALAGGALLAWINWDRVTLLKLVFGGLAFGVLGALAGFTGGGFVQVGLSAWRQAHRHAALPRR